MTTHLWAMGLVLIAAFIGSLGSIFLKKGSGKKLFSVSGLLTNYALIIGVLIYGLSSIFFIPALRGGELSVLYPLASTGYVWTCLLYIKFLDEKMNRYKWLAIIFIIVGISFIGFGS